MKKIIIFCLLIILYLSSKAEDRSEYFYNCIYYDIFEDYNNKEFITDEFSSSLEAKKFEQCNNILTDLEKKALQNFKKNEIFFIYYSKSNILILLNDKNAIDYLYMAKDIDDSYHLFKFIDNDKILDFSNYYYSTNKDTLITKKLEELELKILEINTDNTFKYSNEYEETLIKLQKIYTKIDRPIALMRIEFLRMMKNFNIQDNKLAEENANNILKISKEKDIQNFYSIIAQRVIEKDFISKYKKHPLAGIIVLITIIILAIISTIYFSNKFKDK